jgi:UPF0716 protein FxsA
MSYIIGEAEPWTYIDTFCPADEAFGTRRPRVAPLREVVMRRKPFVIIAILAWFLAEWTAFWAVAGAIGLGGALLLGLATTLLGGALVKKLGQDAMTALRRSMDGGVLREQALRDGTWTAVGAILLILPGFLSDIAGLVLSLPAIRQWLTGQLRPRTPMQPPREPKQPQVIDLSTDLWKPVDEPR